MTASGMVGVFTLGGTIASLPGVASTGVTPTLSGADLLREVPGLAESGIGLEVHDLACVPSSSLSLSDVAVAVQGIHEQLDAGAISGAVVTQGTDTIEETAWLIDLLHQRDSPVVVTGAMRSPGAAGADGPANLLASVRVAAAAQAAGLGALVVMADQIHAARAVRKAHTLSPSAFTSVNTGPVGEVVEGGVRIWRHPERAPQVPGAELGSGLAARLRELRVAVLPAAMGLDAVVVEALAPICDGLVIAGCGAGHVPASWVPALAQTADRIPVILASRTGAGPVAEATYDYPGSEADLLRRGLIGAGYLDPYKARMLLQVALAAGLTTAQIRALFGECSAP